MANDFNSPSPEVHDTRAQEPDGSSLGASEVFGLKPTSSDSPRSGGIRWMATILEVLNEHVTLEVEGLDPSVSERRHWQTRAGLGLVLFMRDQLGKPVPSLVVLGQISEEFRAAIRRLAEREQIPIFQFRQMERTDDITQPFRCRGAGKNASLQGAQGPRAVPATRRFT
jgi:hypothetical protein